MSFISGEGQSLKYAAVLRPGPDASMIVFSAPAVLCHDDLLALEVQSFKPCSWRNENPVAVGSGINSLLDGGMVSRNTQVFAKCGRAAGQKE